MVCLGIEAVFHPIMGRAEIRGTLVVGTTVGGPYGRVPLLYSILLARVIVSSSTPDESSRHFLTNVKTAWHAPHPTRVQPLLIRQRRQLGS